MGVEEELLLVDERTLLPVAASARVLERAGEGVKHELLASFVETATDVCQSPREAAEQIWELRRRVFDACEAEGLRALAIGSHPFATPEDTPVVEDPTT